MKSEKNCLINIGKKGRFSTVPEMFLGCSKNILKRMFQGVKGNLWVFQERIKGDSRGIEWNCNGVFKLVSRKLRVFHGKLRGVPRDLGI